jgi:hypothetical protein
MPRLRIQSSEQDGILIVVEVPVLQLRPLNGLGENGSDAFRRNVNSAAAEHA